MWKIISTLVVVIAGCIWYRMFSRSYRLQEPKSLLSNYDYIIVGSGTAGSVLAARLSEDPTVTVLLLEAGGDHYDVPWSHVPTFSPLLQLTSMNWQLKTVAQEHAAFGFRNRQIEWPRGKCLGGTSVLNYLLYVRGNRANFDRWAELVNDTEWSFAELLPYFMRLEDMQISSFKNTSLHSQGGPIQVTETHYGSKLSELFLMAVQEKGHRLNNYNGMSQNGT